jgi:hypothetical protein
MINYSNTLFWSEKFKEETAWQTLYHRYRLENMLKQVVQK